MAEFLPDILDRIGKTPREFGAIHAHLESAVRGGAGTVATVLFQAAFEPVAPGGRVHFFASSGEQLDSKAGSWELPPLKDGAVVRVRYRLEVPASATRVAAGFDSKVAKNAERVRPAWKLFDTYEVQKLSDMEPKYAADPLQPSSFWDDLLSGDDEGWHFGFSDPVNGATFIPQTKIHKAPELPPVLQAEIRPGLPPPVSKPWVETLWSSGMPLPEFAEPTWGGPPSPVQTTDRPVRVCLKCGFRGGAAEYENSRSCPICDGSWI